MHVAALTTFVIAAVLTALALYPCLGWMNWFVVPFTLIPVVLGTLGLITDVEPGTGHQPYIGHNLAALLGGVMLMGISFVRCLLGGGII